MANYAHALDELNVPELETVLTEDTTWTFAMPGQRVLGPVTGRAAVLDFIRDGHMAQTGRRSTSRGRTPRAAGLSAVVSPV